MRRRVCIVLVILLACAGCGFFPPAPPVVEGPRLRSVDGGPGYYAGFAPTLPTSPEYFPVAVWLESVVEPGDVQLDRQMGINTYAGLTTNSDLGQVEREGSFALTGWTASGASGFMLADEADMWAGAGSAPWSGMYPGEGDICVPASSSCGFTVQESLAGTAPPGMLVYTNYGKGVTFWQSDSDAGRFVNEFQDVVSADNYWFTDPFICGPSEGGAALNGGQPLPAEECRSAANYGWTIDRMRELVEPEGSRPVWALVEVGHPFQEPAGGSIEGPEIRAAVWSSIIHGARGIVYFNHSFGGDCTTQHVLRGPCGDTVRPWVEGINAQIALLAPVLNAPFADGVAASSQDVDLATKLHDGALFVLAASTGDGAQEVTIDVACSGALTAVVIGEERSVPVTDGAIRDVFTDANAVHLYELVGGDTCGLGDGS